MLCIVLSLSLAVDFCGESASRNENASHCTAACAAMHITAKTPLFWGGGGALNIFLVICKTGWCKTGLSEQGYGSYMVHAWCTLRLCALLPWYAGWIYIAVNDSHGYSMSLVCSWNEVGMSYVQVFSSPFCTRPFWRMPNFSHRIMSGPFRTRNRSVWRNLWVRSAAVLESTESCDSRRAMQKHIASQTGIARFGELSAKTVNGENRALEIGLLVKAFFGALQCL